MLEKVRKAGEGAMKIDRFYETLIRRRSRATWALIGSMVFISTATPSSYGLEFPMTSQLTISNGMSDGISGEGASLVANQSKESTPESSVAALYASIDVKSGVTALDLREVSLASAQVELARTPSGAKKVALSIIKAEYPKWKASQQACLVKLWTRESHWNYKAHNYRSGAHGIAQAYPAIKMESIGLDWRTNPVTQIRWGLNYIDKRYDTPCRALARHNWRGAY